MSGPICAICRKQIAAGGTTIQVKDRMAHFECATKNPAAFAKLMYGRAAIMGGKGEGG